MNSNLLIYPLFAMALLPGIILILLAYHRIVATKQGLIEPNYIELSSAEKAPPLIVKLTHNLSNLFEFPVLFYVAACLIISTNTTDLLFVWMSWSYVSIRYVHTIIHVTYNYVPHRLVVHMLSDIVLIAIWMRMLINAL